MSKESVRGEIAEEIFRTVANPQLRNQIIRRGIDAVYPVADQILKIKGILVEAEDQNIKPLDKDWLEWAYAYNLGKFIEGIKRGQQDMRKGDSTGKWMKIVRD